MLVFRVITCEACTKKSNIDYKISIINFHKICLRIKNYYFFNIFYHESQREYTIFFTLVNSIMKHEGMSKLHPPFLIAFLVALPAFAVLS